MSTTRQLNSTPPYTPWLGHIPDLQYTWVGVPEHLDLGSLDPLAIEIFGRDGETHAVEESIDCYNSSSTANQLPAVADSASSLDIDDDEHAYDNNEKFERLLRECIEPEYHLTGSPSSAPLSTTSALDLNQGYQSSLTHTVATEDDAKGFHEVKDASAPSSIRTPSTDEAHTQQSQSLLPQEHGPRFMAMLNDCPALHNREPGPPYKFPSDQAVMAGQASSEIPFGNFDEREHHQNDTEDGRQPEKGPATIDPSAPSILQFLVEFFQSRVQAELEGNTLAVEYSTPSSTTLENLISDRSPSSLQSPPLTVSEAIIPTRPISSPPSGSTPSLVGSSQQKRKREEEDRPSSTKKKAKKTHGHNLGPSATQRVQAPRRRFKQIFVDPSIPKPKRSETWNICTGQSNRKELLNDDERRELIRKQKEARKSSQ